MNCLVVDDEFQAVENVVEMISSDDSLKEHFTSIWKAYDIDEAKKTLCTKKIDVLICDIEMPMGSGIDLLKWMREHQYDTECIVLTCYANFNYLKFATQYGIVDYLLKPVMAPEFKMVLLKAVKNVRIKMESAVKGKGKIIKSVLRNFEYYSYAGIRQSVEKHGIKLTEKYFPLLFSVKYRPLEYLNWEEDMLDYTFRNISGELLSAGPLDLYVHVEKNVYAIWIFQDSSRKYDGIVRAANSVIESLQTTMKWCVCCHIKDAANFVDALNLTREMMEDDGRSLYQGKCVENTQKQAAKSKIDLSEIILFKTLLEQGKYDELESNITGCFLKKEQDHALSQEYIRNFTTDILQIFYAVLSEKHISLMHLIGKQGEMLYRNVVSSYSVEGATGYFEYIIEKLKSINPDNGDLCGRIKEYVANHIGDEISRKTLGDCFHFNADYLNRVFKKNTNLSIKEYVILEKMHVAQELLEDSDMSVGEISKKVGYEQYFYFASCFKKYFGITPSKCRAKSRLRK